MTTPKLTKTQAAVVQAMRDGWELRKSMLSSGSAWLYTSGDKTVTVSKTTLAALLSKGVIEVAGEKFPLKTYRLTQAAS